MQAAFESIVLSETETQEITRFKSFGEDWIARALRQKRARKYLGNICELVKEKSTYGQPYRCCSTGNEVYRRKDNQPIQEDDLAALRAIDNGQENSVSLAASGMEMTHRWLCDSSD